LFADSGPQFEKGADKEGLTGIRRDALAAIVGLSALGKMYSGLTFFGFVAKLVNRNLQFVPGTTLIPQVLLGSNPTEYEKKSLFVKNAMGMGLIILAFQYILGDDDEEDGFTIGFEGDWSSLSGEQRDAKRTIGALPSSCYFSDANGERQYLSYANSSLSWIFSAIGNMREQRINKPKEWEEATALARATGGLFEAGKSAFNTSAMGRLGELLGGGGPYQRKDIGAGAGKFASDVASFAGGFVPSVIRELDYIMDPSYYEPKTLEERAMSVIPFLRRQVADGHGALGAFGDPAQVNRAPTSRVYAAGADTDAERLLARFQDKGLYLPMPDDKKGRNYHSMTGRVIEMKPNQVREYVKLVGQDYQRFILREGESILTMDRDMAKDRISKAAEKIRDRATKMAMSVKE